ncbi:MAG TPA: M20/M25/M40 family metallo-hydrolase [Steroidobacteraceae bacterium]|nr:M20/M25/M40 family metallo-hydrolase [Steroidobacteraceae bacterium]
MGYVRHWLWGALFMAGTAGAASQDPEPAMDAARAHVSAHEEAIIRELRDLVALPNVADDHDDIRRNADALVAMLGKRGIAARILETPGAPVSVFGDLPTPGAKKTLLFYAHFDGQPVGPPERWVTPAFEPTLRAGRHEDGAAIVAWADAKYPLPDEYRIYARAASDDKGPIVAMLAAIDALRAAKIPLSANLKFFLEGEEEAGSPNLARTLAANRELLASDLWIFGDGPIDPRGLPRLALGVRGILTFRLTVYGPVTSLHSGHYGNVAPNPAARVAELIASMRAPDGRITIAGLAAPAPSAAQLALAREGFDTAGMLANAGVAATESGLDYGESILRPALNVTQLAYGGAGAQRNAIDPEASAGFDLRLTPGMTLANAREAVEAHVRGQGYVLLDAPPTAAMRLKHAKLARLEWGEDGYPSSVASPEHPGVARVIEVMQAATDGAVRIAPIMGGSLPISAIGEALGATCVIAPIVNADNSQHAPNENLRMREFRRGIELYAALLALAGEGWRGP